MDVLGISSCAENPPRTWTDTRDCVYQNWSPASTGVRFVGDGRPNRTSGPVALLQTIVKYLYRCAGPVKKKQVTRSSGFHCLSTRIKRRDSRIGIGKDKFDPIIISLGALDSNLGEHPTLTDHSGEVVGEKFVIASEFFCRDLSG